MATQGTKAEISAIEEGQIELFRKEFATLCEKYEINAMCAGSRRESGKFTDESDASMCAAFALAEISNPSIREAKAIKTAYDKASEVVARMVIGAVFNEIKKECECESCKKEEERIAGIKYSQDGNKVCATFADFVNLAESPAGFGDTEEEAKADLLKNAAPSF